MMAHKPMLHSDLRDLKVLKALLECLERSTQVMSAICSKMAIFFRPRFKSLIMWPLKIEINN